MTNIVNSPKPNLVPDINSNSFWGNHEKFINENNIHNTENRTVEDELQEFLKEPILSVKECPFKYYEDNIKRFPNLYKVPRKYISVPATSVPCERIFSKLGHILTQERNSLKPEKLNELLFLSSVVCRRRVL